MSGIIYTPKEPREKVKDRITDESRQRMSEGGQVADRTRTAEVRSKRSLQKFLNDNPLLNNEFYVRLKDPVKGHLRHSITEQLFVSINGKDWFEVSDVVKRIEEKEKNVE